MDVFRSGSFLWISFRDYLWNRSSESLSCWPFEEISITNWKKSNPSIGWTIDLLFWNQNALDDTIYRLKNFHNSLQVYHP